MINKRKTGKEKEALELIEEATHLLRLSPVSAFVFYYAGTVPFILGFLYFWSDMSRSPFAYQYSAAAALYMTLLFIWMKCFHVLFAAAIRAAIHKDTAFKLTPAIFVRILMVQTAVQPTGFIILPLALLIALPFGWAYAFYQNVSYFGDGTDSDITSTCKKSLLYAMHSPGQNHLVLLIVSVIGIFVFFNIGILIIQLPHLLKMFFGTETAFTISGYFMFLNTTYLAVAFSAAYLLLDPFIKTVYALRCFYGESLHTGKDLTIGLKSPALSAKVLLVLLSLAACFCSLTFSTGAYASDMNNEDIRSSIISPSELDESISNIIVRREYSWRMPREKPAEEDKGLLETFIEGAVDAVISWFRPLKKWIKDAIEWLLKKFFNPDNMQVHSDRQWGGTIKTFLYVLIGLLVSLLALFIFREWKRRRAAPLQEASDTAIHIPDINEENISADELPANSWLEMARTLMGQGNTRLALRAFYLASLAHLSAAELIHIAHFKSNREYERELSRNAHHLPDLLSSFSENIGIFEKIWYGMHEITAGIQQSFNMNQERIMAIAEK